MGAMKDGFSAGSGLFADIRDAFRSLRRSGAFTAWVVGSLAIGMAVAIAALALLNAALLLPFQGVTDQDRLVRVSVSENCGRPDCWRRMFSPDDYRALQEGLRSVQGLAAYSFGDVSAGVPDARLLRAIAASPNYFDVLGVRPALGRMFGTGDAATSAAVAVVGHAAWIRELGADPNVIGRSIRVGDGFVQIVGVAPPFFAGVDRTRPGTARSMNVERGPDIWLPLWLADRTLLARDGREPFAERGVYFVGRLAGGADVPQVQAEAAVLARRLAAARVGDVVERPRRRAPRVARESWHLAHWRDRHPADSGTGPVDCLRQRREPDDRARLAAAARDRHPPGHRGGARPGHTAAAPGERAPRSRRNRHRAAGRPMGHAVRQHAARRADPVRPDRPHADRRSGRIDDGGVWSGAGGARQRAASLEHARGNRARTDGRPGQSRARRVLVMAQVALSLGLLATAWQLVATVRGEAVAAGTAPDRLAPRAFRPAPARFHRRRCGSLLSRSRRRRAAAARCRSRGRRAGLVGVDVRQHR